MALLSPVWLITLIPWIAVAIWMCIARQDLAPVPFLILWPRSVPRQSSSRRYDRPPLPVLLCLLAALLGIFAAAQPVLYRNNITRPLVIVVDRGLTMSGKSANGGPRYVGMIRQLAEVIPPWARAEMLSPGQIAKHWDIAATQLPDAAASLHPTALNDRQELQMQVAQACHRLDTPVVVAITDFPVAAPAITVGPDKPPRNVAIASISCRRQPQSGSTSSPRGQVMVRLLNFGNAAHVNLHVQSDGRTQSQDVDVPGNGDAKNCFVDMPSLGASVKAWIDPADDNPLDHAAWLVRQPLWPGVEAHGNVPEPLRRMIQTYTRLRPADESSITVAVQDAALPLPDSPAVCLPDESSPKNITLSDHPQITTDNDPIGIGNLDWPTMLAGATLADPPTGWQVILQADGHPVLATRANPRQVWAGFNSPRASRSVDYVLFWSRVFDWLGTAGNQYTGITVQPLDDTWKAIDLAEPSFGETGCIPGLYRALDGTLQAVNAKVEDMPFTPAGPWREQVRQAMKNVRGQIALSPWLALAALAVLGTAVLLMSRRHE